MQARKIDLKPYTTELNLGDRWDAETGVFVDIIVNKPTDPQVWLRRNLLTTLARHDGDELAVAMGIANKILAAKSEDHVILETSEWEIACGIIKKLRGWGEADSEILNRLRKAPLVEMSEKKPNESKS